MALFRDFKIFEKGGLDKNSAKEFIDKNDYPEAYNVRVTGTQQQEDGYITNIESNHPIATNFPATGGGLNKAIGAEAFPSIRSAISIKYNSAGYNTICKLDYDTQTETVLYTDKVNSASGVQLLQLDPNYYEQIKLINDTYLLWADGKSSIGFTNLNTLESGGYGKVLAEDFSLIKPQCLIPPVAQYINDTGKASNFLKQKLFQYNVQYVGLDYTYSAWSTWSKRIIPISEATPTVGTNITANNAQIVSVNIGSIRVRSLNIGARYDNFDYNIIKQVDIANILKLPFTTVNIANEVYEAYDPASNTYSFVFYNDTLKIGVPATETDLAYDAVPHAATAIERINGNIIALGDLKVGYPRPTTSVTVQSVGYNPNITVPTIPNTDPLRIVGTNPGASGSGQGNHKRLMDVYFSGIAHTGDIMTIVISDIRDANQTLTYTYTVPLVYNGNTEASVASFAPSIPSSTYINFNDGVLCIRFVGPPYYGLQNAYVTLFNAGASVSKSVHAFLDNSSYQAALSYRDEYGRYFPLQTGNNFIFQTQSYAQLQGLTPAMQWSINSTNAPANAVDYQWLVTKNNTTLSVLDVLANVITYLGGWNAHNNVPVLSANVGIVGQAFEITVSSQPVDGRNLGNGPEQFNTGDYVVYNGKSWDIVSKDFAELGSNNILVFKINPLNLFNQLYANNGTTNVLTYDFTPGDTCTVSSYLTGTTPTYINSPCVQLSVLGYDPATFLVKVEKSGSFDSTVLTDKNVLIRLSTPNVQETTTINTTVWYEIGERYTISNGVHNTLSGTITEGDVYFKSRQYQGAQDPNVSYSFAVTDFNFSDFYQSAFTSYGRPRAYNDQLEETQRKASIITSQNYVLGTENNGLTRFYPESIYGDADGQTSSSYGAIRVLWQRNDVLVVLQQLHCGYIPVNISIIEDQIQQQQIAISQKLLNNVRYNTTGFIGIGDVKESFAYYNNHAFFVDPNRSEPIKITLSGLEPIGGKMSKFFKTQIQSANAAGYKMVGYYDTYYNEYVLIVQTAGNTLVSIPFSALSWNPFDSYVVGASDIINITNPANASASYNSFTGIATYIPASGFVGNTVGTFQFAPSGLVKNVCLNWTAGSSAINPFNFLSLTSQPLSTLIPSNTVLISGNTIGVPITITGGSYNINGGSWTSSAGTVRNGDIVQVRVLSSASVDTSTSTTLTVSGYSATFTVKTKQYVTLNYMLTEQTSPTFVDGNLLITQNGVTVSPFPILSSATGVANIFDGNTIQVTGYADVANTGLGSQLQMIVKKDGSNIYSNTIPNYPPSDANMIFNFNSQLGSVYDVNVKSFSSSASAQSCGIPINYSGGSAFPSVNIITLGSSTGSVTLNFDTFNIPAKYQVWYDGVKVIDTGYRGDTAYQGALDASLNGMGLPSEEITSPGSGAASFTKSTATTTAIVYVYAPISSSSWTYNLGCPSSTPTGQFQTIVQPDRPDCVINSITGTGLPAGLSTVNQVVGPPTAFFFTGTIAMQTLAVTVENPSVTPDTNIGVYYSSGGVVEYTSILYSGVYYIPLTRNVVAPDTVRIEITGL